MPRKCSIQGCKSNYDSETEIVSTFSLPKDEPLLSQWLEKIPTDLSKLKHPIICLKHFQESSIIRNDVVVSNGETKIYPRKIPKLIEGAVPSIFPNAPEVASTVAPLVLKIKRSADTQEDQNITSVNCEVQLRSLAECTEEKLIELVRAKPALYNSNHPDYFKLKVKQNIWKEIAKKLQLSTTGAAKSTWEKLRNNHRDALRRQRTAIENGVDPRTMKKWRYQKHMEFLLKYMSLRPFGDSSWEDDRDGNRSQQEVEYVDEDSIMLENLPIEDALQDDMNIIKTGDVPELVYIDSPSYSESPSAAKDSNKRVIIKKQEGSAFVQQSEQMVKKRKLLESDSPNDEMYYFFLSMYKITKKMPPASQHLVRKKIFEAVSQAEADLLDIEDTSQHSYQYDNTSYITDANQADSTLKILPDNA